LLAVVQAALETVVVEVLVVIAQLPDLLSL
jgi:hypothetical protein